MKNILSPNCSKKSQFYIVAAIVIIAVLIGIASYINYARTKTNTRLYDLGEELGLETGYVYDYGVYRGEDFDSLLNNWTDDYLNYTKGQEVIEDWIFVYGNTEGMTAVTFSTVTTGTIGIITGTGSPTQVEITTIKKTTRSIGGGEEAQVKFQNLTYNFKLEKGENFFFIISSKGYVTGAEEE